MVKKNFKNYIIFSVFFILGIGSCSAQDAFTPLQFANPVEQETPSQTAAPVATQPEVQVQRQAEQNTTSIQMPQVSPQTQPKTVENTSTNDDTYYLSATDKFVQSNVRASWTDFKNIINSNNKNDYFYLTMANKMADLGFFDLSALSISKIKDKEISDVSKDAMETFYYPRRKMKTEDEIFLAEMYSNITYNNQSSEAVIELLENNELLSNYDYANYLVALGSYKSNNFPQAKKYINIALIQNPANLNYQALKAKIFSQSEDPSEALKTIASLKKQNISSLEYAKKIKSLEQYVLYQVAKKEWQKEYHLGYYYYLENDNQRAISTLQSALTSRKNPNKGLIYALMSEVYLDMNEFEKASDTAKKAHRSNRRYALVTLGDLSYKNKNYKQSLKYYKKAASYNKKDYLPLVKEAQAYQQLDKIKKAKDIYTKILKVHSDSWEAYLNTGLLDKDREIIYIKKAIAVNPSCEAAWVQLAKLQLDKGNYEEAQKYLSNAFCIDENDFKYYYYQGLLDKSIGNYNQAKSDFSKCLRLNSNFKEARDELNNLNGIQEYKIQQGNI